MTATVDDQLGLFDLADLVPPPPPLALALPNNLLPAQEEAAAIGDGLLLIEIAEAWQRERQREGWHRVRTEAGPTYAWTPPGWSDVILGRGDHGGLLLSVDLRCDCRVPRWRGSALAPRPLEETCRCPGDLIYRIVCPGCGWCGPAHDCENDATADALDHCWPGWAQLPTAPRWSYDGPTTGRDAAAEKWLAACVAVGYDEQWIRDGGPIRTARSPMGTRHVPAATPFRGVDAWDGVDTTD